MRWKITFEIETPQTFDRNAANVRERTHKSEVWNRTADV